MTGHHRDELCRERLPVPCLSVRPAPLVSILITVLGSDGGFSLDRGDEFIKSINKKMSAEGAPLEQGKAARRQLGRLLKDTKATLLPAQRRHTPPFCHRLQTSAMIAS